MSYQVSTDIWVPIVLIDSTTRLNPVTGETGSGIAFRWGMLDGLGVFTTLTLSASNLKEKAVGVYEVKLRGSIENVATGMLIYAISDAGTGVLPYYNTVEIVSHDPETSIATLLTRIGVPASDLATVLNQAALDSEINRKIMENGWKIDTATNQFIVYDDNQSSPFRTFDLKDSSGTPTSSNVFERVRV